MHKFALFPVSISPSAAFLPFPLARHFCLSLFPFALNLPWTYTEAFINVAQQSLQQLQLHCHKIFLQHNPNLICNTCWLHISLSVAGTVNAFPLLALNKHHNQAFCRNVSHKGRYGARSGGLSKQGRPTQALAHPCTSPLVRLS